MKKLLNTIIAACRREAEKLRPLTFRQKLQYIWDYYRVQIFLILFILFAGISLIKTIYKAHEGGTVVFGVGIVNNLDPDNTLVEYISSGFGEYLGLTYGKEQVSANSGYTVTWSGIEYEEITSLMLLIDASAGSVDAVICEEDVIEYFYTDDESAWRDLRTITDEETLSALEDRLYYTTDADGVPYPCGVYLSDTHLCTETSLTLEEPILVFAVAGVHDEYMGDFLDYAVSGIER